MRLYAEQAMAKGILLSWVATDHDPYYSEHRRGAFLEWTEGLLPGPSLSLATDAHYGPRISRYVLLHQSEYSKQAEAIRKVLTESRAKLWPERDFDVDLIDMGTFRPIDHEAIWRGLSVKLREVLEKYPSRRKWGPGSPLWNFAYQNLYWDRRFDESNPQHWRDLERETPAGVRQAQEQWERVQEQEHEYFVCLSQGTPAMHAIWLVIVQAGIIRATLLQTIPPQYRCVGESCASEVSIDIGKLPMPIVQDIKRSGIRERVDLEKLGRIARLSHFMAANIYCEDQSYGLYRLTHTPTSQSSIEESLRRVDGDLEDVSGLLSKAAKDRVERYITEARIALNESWQHFERWSEVNRGRLKETLRFSFKDWVKSLKDRYEPGGIVVEDEWDEDAQIFPEIYADCDVVRRGLDAIIENMAGHAYCEGEENRSLVVEIRRNPHRMEIVLKDTGRGFGNLRDRFHKGSGSTGGGLADIRLLADWFQVRIESTSNVAYDITADEEQSLRTAHTGTRYVLYCRLPPTLESRASERVE